MISDEVRAQPLGTFDFPVVYAVRAKCRLECTAGSSNKFYAIEVHGGLHDRFRVVSRYGRIGAAGVSEERIPPEQTFGEAMDFYHALRFVKLRKGYVDVSSDWVLSLAATKTETVKSVAKKSKREKSPPLSPAARRIASILRGMEKR